MSLNLDLPIDQADKIVKLGFPMVKSCFSRLPLHVNRKDLHRVTSSGSLERDEVMYDLSGGWVLWALVNVDGKILGIWLKLNTIICSTNICSINPLMLCTQVLWQLKLEREVSANARKCCPIWNICGDGDCKYIRTDQSSSHTCRWLLMNWT